MTKSLTELRRFSKAPVIETVLSIQFNPIKGFSIVHFGLYWDRIRRDFPNLETKQPVAHIVENFGQMGTEQSLFSQGEIKPEQLVRCWFLEENRSSFIQLQPDRLIVNWQVVEAGDVYPRYTQLRAKLHNEWRRFTEFLRDEKLEAPRVDQCEVTYVNHIEYHDGWDSYDDLNKVISPWSGKTSEGFLKAPEKIGLNVQYLIDGNRGRLYISLQPVIRRRDNKEVLQLNLTARGAPSSSQTEDVFQWLDLGRKWIVNGFTDFVTLEMHKRWGREV